MDQKLNFLNTKLLLQLIFILFFFVAPVITLAQADLEISQTIRHNGNGTNATFMIVVRNNSTTTPATNVSVNDVLNAGWTFTNLSSNYKASHGGLNSTFTTAQNIRWDGFDISPGGVAVLIFNTTYSFNFWEYSSANATVTSPDDPDSPISTGIVNSSPDYSSQSLSITKTISEPNPLAGVPVLFTIEVQKSGSTGGSDAIQVIDKLPSGYVITGSPGYTVTHGTYTPSTGVWNVGGTWDSWGPATLTITAIPQSPTGAPDEYKNVASITISGVETNISNNMAVLEVIPEPDLESTDLKITKTVNEDEPMVGDNVTFTIEVENLEGNDATGVTVTDVIPSGYEFVNSTQGTYNAGTKTVTWSVGNLAVAGPAPSFDITAKVLGTGNYTNTAFVTHSASDPVPGNNSDTASVTPIFPEADLEITSMTIDNTSPSVGQNVTFTINVINNGPDSASGVTVSATLPSGLEYVSNIPSIGTYNSNSGVWTIGNLADEANANLKITAKVLATGDYTYNATISGSVDDPTPSNNTANDNITNTVDLAITKTASPPTPNIGDPVTFTIGVENIGVNPATGVMVKDVIPSGYNYTGNSGGATYDVVTRTVTWNVGNLAPASTASFTITATARAGGNHNNIASVFAQQGDSNPGNNQDNATVTPNLGNAVDLKVTQSVNNEVPNIGNNIFFTITAQNLGPNPATGVIINNLLANGLQYVNHETITGNYDSGTGVWTIGNMINAATATLTIEAQVLPGAGAAYVSIAEITGTEAIFDNNIINNRAYSILSPVGQEFLECDVNAENPVFEENFGSGVSIFGGELPEGRTNLEYFEPPNPPGTWSEDESNYVADGRYVIGQNANDAFNVWQNMPDHTGLPNGYYMIMNADLEPHEFFRMRIDLEEEFCSNTQYTVSVWVANINSEADYVYCTGDDPSGVLILPEIGYFIQNNIGDVLGAGTSGEIQYNANAQWVEYTFIFTTSDEDEYVDLVLFNKAPGGCGNDLAIDDISVYACMTPPIRLDMQIESEKLEVCGGEDLIMTVVYIPDPDIVNDDYVWPPTAWGSVPVVYQWQKSDNADDPESWVDIPGETTDTYTIEDFSPSDQAYYRLLYAQDGNIDKASCRFPSEDLFPIFNATPVLNPIESINGKNYVCPLPGGELQLTNDYLFSDEYDDWDEDEEGHHYFLWESDTPSVATIDPITGMLTAHMVGITTITYTVWSPKGFCHDSVEKEIYVLEDCPSCIEDPDMGPGGVESSMGISTLEKQLEEWMENIPNGFIVLESKNKGFVITRIANEMTIEDPQEGMLIYDESVHCVKLFYGNQWHCIQQDCD